MNNNDKICVTDDQIGALINETLIPELKNIARRAKRELILTPFIMSGKERIRQLDIITAGKSGKEKLEGEMQLSFREGFGNLRLMSCECIVREEQTVANFSGFVISANIIDGKTRTTGLVIRYSVWHWMGWS